MEGSNKKLLIFDLNGVLVTRNRETKEIVPRPGLKAFLDWCFQHFEVAFWSSGQKHNIGRIVFSAVGFKRVKRLLFLWGQDKCIVHPEEKFVFKKPITKVWGKFPGYNETNTFIVDDNPKKLEDNPESTWFVVETWNGVDSFDNIQERLLEKLK